MRWRLADSLTKNMVERLAELQDMTTTGGSTPVAIVGAHDTPLKVTPVGSPPNGASFLPRIISGGGSSGNTKTNEGGVKLPSTAASSPPSVPSSIVPPLSLPIAPTATSPVAAIHKPSGADLPAWAQSVNTAPSKIVAATSANAAGTAASNASAGSGGGITARSNPPMSSRWHQAAGAKIKLASELEPSGVEIDVSHARQPLVSESISIDDKSPKSPNPNDRATVKEDRTPVRDQNHDSNKAKNDSPPTSGLSDTQTSVASITPVRRNARGVVSDINDQDDATATPVRPSSIPELPIDAFTNRDRDDDDNVVGTDFIDDHHSPRNRPPRVPSRLESKDKGDGLHDDIEVSGADDEDEDGEVDEEFLRDNYEEDETIDERKMMRQSITHDFFSANKGARAARLAAIAGPSVVDSADLSVDSEDATNKLTLAMRAEMERKGIFASSTSATSSTATPSVPVSRPLGSLVVPLTAPPPVITPPPSSTSTPLTVGGSTSSTTAPSSTASGAQVASKTGRGVVHPESNDISVRYGTARRVLIAHDQSVTINIITRALPGWIVTPTNNGLQAVEAVRKLATDDTVDGVQQYGTYQLSSICRPRYLLPWTHPIL
jgi:hypothetical protein